MQHSSVVLAESSDWDERMIYRLIDIVVSGSCLLIFLPFGLIIVLILRFTGEGNVFYLQPRMGKDGTHFKMIKFVTMVENSENMGTGTVTSKNDSRVLPFGKVLRKTKLNEVPQLINLLKGDMTLVGPRPLSLRDYSYYSKDMQRAICSMRPGLTGIGSIIFRDEETIMARSPKSTLDCYEEDIIPYKGELELWYKENRSLGLNMKIIFITALVVLMPGNNLYKRVFKGLPEDTYGVTDGVGGDSEARSIG